MREATKQDLPKGREAQCVLCWRMFGSNSTCELHKPYVAPTTPLCKDPLDIGLLSRERLARPGVAVWVQPMPEIALNRCGRGSGSK
jgi:hypothetical protein